MEWLAHAAYEPAVISDLSRLADELVARRVEASIVDASLVSQGEIPALVRRLGINRPLILVGDPGASPGGAWRDLSWLERPVSRESLLLSVALALAEGRPARRSPRRPVDRLLASVDGVESRVLDVSPEGVRIEIAGTRPGNLPPHFTLRLPNYGVRVSVRRVWVASPTGSNVWCGGIIDSVLPGSAQPWSTFVQEVPKASGIFANSRI
jgi:hypothetical protein